MILQPPHQFRKAAFYSVIAYLIIAVGIVVWKSVIADYGTPQILAVEAVICFPLYLGLAKIKGGFHLLKTAYPFLQVLRGILQTCAAYVGLYGLLHLPVSTYAMIGYCSPFIITIAAVFFLKEKCPPIGWLYILIGLVGTLLVIQPEYTNNSGAVLASILSSCFWAANVILMRQMPEDDVISFPFYTLVIVGFISCLITLINGITPMPPFDFSMIAISGIFFFVGAQILFVTYRLSPLYFSTPFQYTQIVWIIILSFFFWKEIPTVIQFLGLALIATGSICSSFLKKEETALLLDQSSS